MRHGSCQIIPAAQSGHFMEQDRVFEGEVSGMIGAQAAAGCNESAVRGLLSDQGQHLLQYVLLVLQMPGDPCRRWNIPGIKTLPVDAVQAIDLQVTCFDLMPEGFDHEPVFIIIEMGGTGWEKQYRLSGMSEDQ